MPLIKIETSANIPDDKRVSILKKASGIVADNTGKAEQYIMVTLAKVDLAMAGTAPATGAYVDVRGIGGINDENNSGISRDICKMLHKELGIAPANIYLNFTDVPAGNWGHNGATFAR